MKFLPWILAVILVVVAAQQIAATPTDSKGAPLRLAQVPTEKPWWQTPFPTPVAPTVYAQPFVFDLDANVSRFDRRTQWGEPKEEKQLVLRSWQNITPLDKPFSNRTSDIRFAEMTVSIADSKTKSKIRDLPMRWNASGGFYRESVFIPSSGKNLPIGKVKTNESGFATSQWVPKKPGFYQLWVEVLKPDGSVFQRSKKIPIRVRNASWKARVKTGEWSETSGQTNVYQRSIYLMWQLDDPAQVRRLVEVPLAPSVRFPDGAPAPANLSWFDSKTALSLPAPGQGLNDGDLSPNLTQFARYDPVSAPVRDLDAFLVSAKLAAPISAQLQKRMDAEEAREDAR